MSINISGYDFEGPYTDTDDIENKSGVYAILNKVEGNKYKVIDIGESKEVKNRLDTHDRYDCWVLNCNLTIYYAVYYTPNKQGAGRRAVEKELRDQFQPPCGER